MKEDEKYQIAQINNESLQLTAISKILTKGEFNLLPFSLISLKSATKVTVVTAEYGQQHAVEIKITFFHTINGFQMTFIPDFIKKSNKTYIN